MEEDRGIGLHLMQSNSTCRAYRGKFGFFWEKHDAVAWMKKVWAPGSSQKMKSKVVQRGTLAKVLPTYT